MPMCIYVCLSVYRHRWPNVLYKTKCPVLLVVNGLCSLSAWNSLPDCLRDTSDNISVFRPNLKSRLLAQCTQFTLIRTLLWSHHGTINKLLITIKLLKDYPDDNVTYKFLFKCLVTYRTRKITAIRHRRTSEAYRMFNTSRELYEKIAD